MAAILLVIVAAGGYLRLHDLDRRSITHPEMYVPGIPLPEGLSEPQERVRLSRVMTGTFSADTHPPAYYVFMWAWTKVFGSGITSIRLPSALMGAGSLLLVFWIGSLMGRPVAGLVAAALLALSGFHVFWSQVARMYSMACFLGLLSTALLLLLARGKEPRRLLRASYAVVVLIGLSTHIFFWTVLLTHTLWVAVNGAGRSTRMPGLCRRQVLLIVLGSPLLAFAAYQTGNTLAILSDDWLLYARQWMQFAFLIPSGDTAWLPTESTPAWGGAVRALLLLLSIALLIVSVVRRPRSAEELALDGHGPSYRHWFLAAGLGFAAVWGFVATARAFLEEPYATIRMTEMMSLLPFALAAVGTLVARGWSRIDGLNLRKTRLLEPLRGSQGLILLLGLLPLAVLAVISTGKPILNQRGMLFMVPYLLLLLAIGLVHVCRRRWVALMVAAALAVPHAWSLHSYRGMRIDPGDYKSLAEVMIPQVRESDLIFLRRRWDTTPILYYLSADRFRLVADRYSEACRENPDSRVWSLLFYEDTGSPGLMEALAGYEVIRRIELPHLKALLYSKAGRNEHRDRLPSEPSPTPGNGVVAR